MGAGVSPVVQGLVWGIVATALFVLGGFAVIVTVSKAIKSFKDSNDAMSVDTFKILAVGGSLAALSLFGGVYTLIKVMGAVNKGVGLG